MPNNKGGQIGTHLTIDSSINVLLDTSNDNSNNNYNNNNNHNNK